MFCLVFRVMVTDHVPLTLVAARRCPVLIWTVISAWEIGLELVVSVSLPLNVMRLPKAKVLLASGVIAVRLLV